MPDNIRLIRWTVGKDLSFRLDNMQLGYGLTVHHDPDWEGFIVF